MKIALILNLSKAKETDHVKSGWSYKRLNLLEKCHSKWKKQIYREAFNESYIQAAAWNRMTMIQTCHLRQKVTLCTKKRGTNYTKWNNSKDLCLILIWATFCWEVKKMSYSKILEDKWWLNCSWSKLRKNNNFANGEAKFTFTYSWNRKKYIYILLQENQW